MDGFVFANMNKSVYVVKSIFSYEYILLRAWKSIAIPGWAGYGRDMPASSRHRPSDLVEIYKCLCDETRLRILHLLSHQALCVCHFQAILDAPQVKVSKHLAYLRERGMVETRREGAWMVYSLPRNPSRELTGNLQCLQDCCSEQAVFTADLRRMKKELAASAGPFGGCGGTATSGRKQ